MVSLTKGIARTVRSPRAEEAVGPENSRPSASVPETEVSIILKTRPIIPLIILQTLLLCTSVWAQDKAATSLRSRSHLFARGVQELGLSVGWGVASPVGPQNGQIEDLQFINVSPRWGIGITDPLGGSAWYHGNFEFLAEGTYLREFEPIHGHSVGITALVRYNFIRDGKVIPFAEIGGGIHSLNFDLRGQEDGLNFSGQGGFGLHYFISEQTAVTAGWRFVHISNGNNLGLNDSVILIGISTFFP